MPRIKLPKITKENLYRLYWKENRSLNQIASMLNRNSTTILYHMGKFTIPRRTIVEAYEIKRRKITKKDLLKLYLQKKNSPRKIGQLLKCSREMIKHRLKDFNIPIRNAKQSAQFNSGVFRPRKIDISPTIKLGYLCGLILGDGYIIATKNRNYWIALETTKLEMHHLFRNAVKSAFPNLHCYTSERIKRRSFPNGTIREDLTYLVRVDSKILYQALRPYKKKDYHWKIPVFLTTKKSKIGFLKGIYDAEGWVSKHHEKYYYIGLSSKHQGNLFQIIDILKMLNIEAKLYQEPNRSCSRLVITKKQS